MAVSLCVCPSDRVAGTGYRGFLVDASFSTQTISFCRFPRFANGNPFSFFPVYIPLYHSQKLIYLYSLSLTICPFLFFFFLQNLLFFRVVVIIPKLLCLLWGLVSIDSHVLLLDLRWRAREKKNGTIFTFGMYFLTYRQESRTAGSLQFAAFSYTYMCRTSDRQETPFSYPISKNGWKSLIILWFLSLPCGFNWVQKAYNKDIMEKSEYFISSFSIQAIDCKMKHSFRVIDIQHIR